MKSGTVIFCEPTKSDDVYDLAAPFPPNHAIDRTPQNLLSSPELCERKAMFLAVIRKFSYIRQKAILCSLTLR